MALAEKGYTIPGLTTPIIDDIAQKTGLPKEEIKHRDKIAKELGKILGPDTPIDDNFAKLETLAVELDKRLSSIEFRLTSIESQLQAGKPDAGRPGKTSFREVFYENERGKEG
jgi:hypothetical protein